LINAANYCPNLEGKNFDNKPSPSRMIREKRVESGHARSEGFQLE
jgi:hypothetical protein